MLAEFAIHDPDTEWERERERVTKKLAKERANGCIEFISLHLTLHEYREREREREERKVILDTHSYSATNGKAEAIESIAKQDPIKYKSSHLACNLSE